ncbi:10413_t:CDS:2 [Funneliformis geosporum]|uniref:Dynactin subunit 6 n=1 Tax=Funneliformis geosporum TaxID=1117311 RepID=A0A9W4WNZ3_9GLOM|nr:5448_t:CDS:2 [Funneliformis geosporum]CAI2176448.1 10413_t:CDS:2 [Funneliformis geosporum]
MPKEQHVLNIGKRAVVCQDIELKGEIQIGAGGPIIIGQNNIVEENVTILNKLTRTLKQFLLQILNFRLPTALTIGDDNVFEVGCYVEGSKIGSKNIIEAKARILGSTSLGNNCVVGAVCSTKEDENISDNTVIFGDHHNRRIQTASANQLSSLHTRHLDYLREVLPKFNHIRVSGAPESQEVAISRKAIKQTASH